MKKLLLSLCILLTFCSLSLASVTKSVVYKISVTIPEHVVSRPQDDTFLTQEFMQTADSRSYYKQAASRSDTLVEMILRDKQPVILKSITTK